MIIRIAYLQTKTDGIRKDIIFDTEKKEILDEYNGFSDAFVEAKEIDDVKNLRRTLLINGYQVSNRIL